MNAGASYPRMMPYLQTAPPRAPPALTVALRFDTRRGSRVGGRVGPVPDCHASGAAGWDRGIPVR